MKLYIILTSITVINAYIIPHFFKQWHCIGIKDKIDFTIPYVINICDLPLVIWKDDNNKLLSTINICKHMGSKLNNANIIKGCLKCRYHGYEYTENDKFGEIIEYEDKIFWSLDPINRYPHSLPFYTDSQYKKTIMEFDMDASLTDSAYNTMDIRHPEYIHNKILGFGSNNPPTNLKEYYYNNESIGLQFDYESNDRMKLINKNIKLTHNLHTYLYPSFSWSIVSFNYNNLIIGVNFLPLAKKKTRWFVTICHNYYKSQIGKNIIKNLANLILNQDSVQMKNQCEDNILKKNMLFEHTFEDEETLLRLNDMLKDYKYYDINDCHNIYTTYKNQLF